MSELKISFRKHAKPDEFFVDIPVTGIDELIRLGEAETTERVYGDVWKLVASSAPVSLIDGSEVLATSEEILNGVNGHMIQNKDGNFIRVEQQPAGTEL